jgi:hypothetical protein
VNFWRPPRNNGQRLNVLEHPKICIGRILRAAIFTDNRGYAGERSSGSGAADGKFR